MDENNLRERLINSSNKLDVFKDFNFIKKYKANVILEFINEFLDYNEKINLFNFKHFATFPFKYKLDILKSITNNKLALELIKQKGFAFKMQKNELLNYVYYQSDNLKKMIIDNDSLISMYELEAYDVGQIVESFSSDKLKLKYLKNKEFRDKYILDQNSIESIFTSFKKEDLEEVLNDTEFVKSEHESGGIIPCIKKIDNIALKEKYINLYNLNNEDVLDIFKFESDRNKQTFLLNNMDRFNNEELISFISTLNYSLSFVIENKDYLDHRNIEIAEIFQKSDKAGIINIDLNNELEKYRGFDKYINVNPMKLSQEEKEKFFKLCEICPGMKISDDLGLGESSVEEYIKGEEWINSVIEKVDESWSDVEKIAYISYQIGDKISYSADFETEVFDEKKSRATWKIIVSGYGVCNGISTLAKYMLEKVGINSELVESKDHAFLLLKGINIPNDDGTVKKGNTLLDVTWDMAEYRFGDKPDNLCIDYDEIRQHDIDSEGIDTMHHLVDDLESLQNRGEILSLDKSLYPEIFRKIGIKVDEYGFFEIDDLKAKIFDINNVKYDYENMWLEDLPSIEERISKSLSELPKYRPDFANCQNSTMYYLEQIFSRYFASFLDRCVIKRVYDKNDNEKKLLYMYI